MADLLKRLPLEDFTSSPHAATKRHLDGISSLIHDVNFGDDTDRPPIINGLGVLDDTCTCSVLDVFCKELNNEDGSTYLADPQGTIDVVLCRLSCLIPCGSTCLASWRASDTDMSCKSKR